MSGKALIITENDGSCPEVVTYQSTLMAKCYSPNKKRNAIAALPTSNSL